MAVDTMTLDFDNQVETGGLLHHLVCMKEEQLDESCRILVRDYNIVLGWQLARVATCCWRENGWRG